ncbi:hypothetical protein GCM10007049_00950 [Echinicola pacifica]|uniref:Uncharacterized protein n=2 Tax=Echinicola pacifica TaxID=346377 RepID=A0A918PKQ7_9BACT|nr:hypothetical protein GCM10007049_00950 [Echinicola pacifica]
MDIKLYPLDILFKRFFKKKSIQSTPDLMAVPSLLKELPSAHTEFIRLQLLHSKALRLLERIPVEYRGLDFGSALQSICIKLTAYLQPHIMGQEIMVREPEENKELTFDLGEFAAKIKGLIHIGNIRLEKTELIIHYLEHYSYTSYTSEWGKLSNVLKSALADQGLAPNQLQKLKELNLDLRNEPSRTQFGVLEGIKYLDQIQKVEINGVLEQENEFNKLSLLPNLTTLLLDKGPKVSWPLDKLTICHFPALKKIIIKEAYKFEDYQIIYYMDSCSEVVVRKFDPSQLKYLINIRCLEQFNTIDIHCSKPVEEEVYNCPQLYQLIHYYGEFRHINIFTPLAQ